MTAVIIIILVLVLLLVIAGFVIYFQIDQRKRERFAHEVAVAEYRKLIAEKRAEMEKLKGAIDDTKKENLAAVSGPDPAGNFGATVDVLQNLATGSSDRKGRAPRD